MNSPWGQLPYLTLPSGEVYGQSDAILRYVGRLTGLLPTDIIEEFKVNELVGFIQQDLRDRKVGRSMSIKDPAEKAAYRAELNDDVLPKMLDSLVEKMDESGFLCLGHLTIADLCLYTFLNWISMGVVDGVDGKALVLGRPKLLGFMENLSGLEGVKEWNEEQRKGKIPIDFRA
ncbi:hypothetical protein TL16_g10606 [Triparma laevis f. inornata]|nr:hypothetical protein TL16_g10606 [Triparma laevis f. inornata]